MIFEDFRHRAGRNLPGFSQKKVVMTKSQAVDLIGKRILISSNGFQTVEAVIKEISPSGEQVKITYEQTEWKPLERVQFIEELNTQRVGAVTTKPETR